MEPAGIAILFILFVAFILLIWKDAPADFVFIGALILIIVLNLVPVSDALVGFSNEGMLTVAALYVVALGMKETGAIQFVIHKLLGTTRSEFKAQSRIIGPVFGMSAFLNNTPIVASFIPAIKDWSKLNQIPGSKLLIPLSYAAILGGTCTLIGTSTNLIVNGLLIESKQVSMNIFDPAYVGLPVAVVGIGYLLLFSRKLLPNRSSGFASFDNTREYTIEMIVPNNSTIAGKSIEEAGLRHLPGLFLVEIVRKERIIAAVEPSEILQKQDRLIFTGVVDAMSELQKISGLQPATEQVFKLDAPRNERHLVEAVIAPSNPLNGMTIKEGEFRNRFGAVVLAVSRDGERIKTKVGDIRLRTGDILLLETPRDFTQRFRSSNDFLLVSTLSTDGNLNTEKAGVAWLILGLMVGVAAFGLLSMFKAAFLAAGAMILTKCCNFSDARRSIDWQVLLVIASALGIGNALQVTGVASTAAGGFIGWAGVNPLMALIAVYLATWLLTEMITNNAAAALIFPIAITIADSMGVSYMPFVMAIIFAASASFSTPIGYQTNLMVMGPGGYKFTDYIKIGLPLNIAVATVALLLIPVIWPF
ncbi:SLC13 family permease [Rhodohalobacter barkolensis]|uniref:SLC13 family permease n=1 Tax=Rhodohalobacter barkolensis TaxID=2053187 RepID=A0A2N0VKE1_9BACT|nr:SLC13 family permease [Rhodohalobacter barkolensis]PKD44665.1 SLC13 family permease [Rhodohalobacter barkolensis]